MRKIMSLVLILALLLSISVSAFATTTKGTAVILICNTCSSLPGCPYVR